MRRMYVGRLLRILDRQLCFPLGFVPVNIRFLVASL